MARYFTTSGNYSTKTVCADWTPPLKVITPFVLITSVGRLLQNLTAFRPSHLTDAAENSTGVYKRKNSINTHCGNKLARKVSD